VLDFTYYNPTRVHFGQTAFEKISGEIPKGAKVLMMYGGGSIKKNGVYERCMEQLKGFEVTEFSGIEANPTYETLMNAVGVVKSEGITFLLAVGGGSVIDGTKFVAAASEYLGDDPWDMLNGKAQLKDGALPFGTVLTLAATGSEMNMFSVVTKKATKEKRGFGNPALYPQFSILDPTSTFSVPAKQTANGVVDAFVHVMEQYLTFPVGSPVQDRLAEGLLLTLIEQGPKVLKNPHDFDLRGDLMWAASMALNGTVGCGVLQDWSTHMIGHELTAEYGIDHAQTLAIVLPSVMNAMRDDKKEKLLQYGERVWKIQTGTEKERIDLVIEETRSFFEDMGLETRLSDYDVPASDIPKLISRLEEKGFVAMGEHKKITPEVSKKILEASL